MHGTSIYSTGLNFSNYVSIALFSLTWLHIHAWVVIISILIFSYMCINKMSLLVLQACRQTVPEVYIWAVLLCDQLNPEWITPEWLQSDWIHFVFLNQIFCRIGSAFRVTGMGIADWLESQLPKTALAVASCFSAKANGYDWKWTAREHFKVLLSNETVAFLLGMVWWSFDATVSIPNYCQACWLKKLMLGHIMELVDSICRDSADT